MTRTERIIVAPAFAGALVNLLFRGMGLLSYVCLVVVLVVGGSSTLRCSMQRQSACDST
ncbi:hypothetical protein ACX80N_10145 [Arthrobacter sp. MDT2-16]|uniref:hypothetical protein n=1 Tax=Arthrobacter ruber TaxID=1258893 RepID=UPI0012FFDEE3|nr:hypothetical protein [Arthrobacter ruber]